MERLQKPDCTFTTKDNVQCWHNVYNLGESALLACI